MIESIEFTNFKALRQTTLPLAPFTLLLGPNGSGKSSVLQAIQGLATLAGTAQKNRMQDGKVFLQRVWTPEPAIGNPTDAVQIKLNLKWENQDVNAEFIWAEDNGLVQGNFIYKNGKGPCQVKVVDLLLKWLARIQTYAMDARVIKNGSQVSSQPLREDGFGLPAVLDDLRDEPDRWNLLVAEMRRWLPEYSNIEFDKPGPGHKAISLRTSNGGHRIPAIALSQGTLIALALLTLAYLPNPPTVIGLEEIDRGLHPRLLRQLQHALYRLSYPESCVETLPPVQVIATTHSPYLLDLYRDHPEEVVLAEKEGLEVKMRRLSDIDHFEEILGESPLSDVWYSGVLGGATVKP